MANQVVKLKKGSDYLYPYADYVGLDQSNLLSSQVKTSSDEYGELTYTATQDCMAFFSNAGIITLNSVTILNSGGNLYGLNYIFPLKKGDVFILGGRWGITLKIYGLKRTTN